MAVDISTLSGGVRAAFIANVKAKVAGALGLQAEAVKFFEESFERKLQRARIEDLELSTSDDPVVQEVIAAIRAPFGMDDPKLPIAMDTLFSRVEAVRDSAFKEVRDAYEWSWLDENRELTLESAMDGLAKAAFITLVTEKLAIPCGLDANAVQLMAQKYHQQLIRAITTEISRDIALGEDSKGEMRKACEEVRHTLEIPAEKPLDSLALAAAGALCHIRQVSRAQYDANFMQLKEQEYTAKIQEWRKINLNQSLAGNDDPILAELLVNFRSDDPSLANTYNVYKQRVSAVKLSAYSEIERSHNWQWISKEWTEKTPLEEKVEAMDGLTKSAFIALATKLLAVSCGLTPEMTRVYEKQYQTRLRLARVADLETTEIVDPIQNEVLALIRSTFSGDAALPRDMKTLTDKINALKEMARKEVLSAHDWSFAQCDYTCESAATEHPDQIFRYHVTLPKGCLLISACYGTDGKVAQWKLRGNEVHALSPITRVVFIKDCEDYTKWHPKAYRAFILRLVADVTKCVAESPKERALQEQLYRDALEEATTSDARNSNTPDEAWGDNDIADVMLNGTRRDRRIDSLFYGGV